MSEDQRKRHIGLALIKPEAQGKLFAINIRNELLRALDPALKVERYRRVWRISKLEDKGGYLCGKLGFFKSKLTEEMYYDEKIADFVTLERDSREGALSCFVLYTPNKEHREAILAFEEHPPDIRRQSFIGAFSNFLLKARSPYEVQSARHEIKFVTWLAEMERIIEFSGTFRKPNPRWHPRTQQVQDIIEQTNANRMKIVAKADKNSEGLMVGESILGGIVEHTQEGRYGVFKAKGISNGSEFTYYKGSSEINEVIVEEDGDSIDNIYQKIIGVIQKRLEDLL